MFSRTVGNSPFDARNFVDATIGTLPFKRHQFGGALGGLLKNDQIFLFGNYEAFEQRLALSNVAEVPDANARLGLLPCNVIGPAAGPCPPSGYALVPNLKPLKANSTFAKGIDLNSAVLAPAGENKPAAVFTPYNLKLSRGLTACIVQHQFNANFSYELPFGRHRARGPRNQLIGGWQWNGIFTVQTGACS